MPSGWSEKWNSSFCPVVWGAELSDEDNYVVCVTVKEGFISNGFADTVLTPPIREGYTFIGWNSNVLSDEAEYSLADLVNIKKEIKLYSVWKESE